MCDWKKLLLMKTTYAHEVVQLIEENVKSVHVSNPIQCGCDMWLSYCPFSPLSPVLAELQGVDLITERECKRLGQPSDLVRVQRGKSPEVQVKTADILREHGFEKESNLLAGKQTQPLLHVPVVCCTVEPSCKDHLKASIISLSVISFTTSLTAAMVDAYYCWQWSVWLGRCKMFTGEMFCKPQCTVFALKIVILCAPTNSSFKAIRARMKKTHKVTNI